MFDDFTIVIQGKFHANTQIMADYHVNIPTIISTWKPVSKQPKLSDMLSGSLRPNLSIIETNLPDPRGLNNQGNRYFQFLSTLNGLYAVKTKYAIKVRTDEYYSDLRPIMQKVLGTGKTITGDVYFKKTKVCPYHPSDHIIAGRTDFLRKIFYTITSDCIYRSSQELFCPYPETHFGRKLISLSENIPVPKLPASPEAVKRLMSKYFDIVNSCELGDFCVTSNGLKKQYKNSTGYYNIRNEIAFSIETEL